MPLPPNFEPLSKFSPLRAIEGRPTSWFNCFHFLQENVALTGPWLRPFLCAVQDLARTVPQGSERGDRSGLRETLYVSGDRDMGGMWSGPGDALLCSPIDMLNLTPVNLDTFQLPLY